MVLPATPRGAHLLRRLAGRVSFGPTGGLARRIARHLGRNCTGIARIHDFMGKITLDLDLSEHMQSRIFWLGGYNLAISNLMRSILSPSMTFVDVGANIGELSLGASLLVGERGMVYSFEPSADVLSRLRHHVHVNGAKNIQVFDLALGSLSGTVPLYGKDGPTIARQKNDGLASLVRPADQAKVISEVRVETLDGWIDQVQPSRLDVIKVDIEGGEFDFLLGAGRTLEKFRPKIILELSKMALAAAGQTPLNTVEKLAEYDYEVYHIDSRGRPQGLIVADRIEYCDVLCVPKEKHAAW